MSTEYTAFAILVRIKGGKELKFEKGRMPDHFPPIGSLEPIDGSHILVKKLPPDEGSLIEVDDALAEQLTVKGEYATWLLIDVLLTGDPDKDAQLISEKKEFMLKQADVVVPVDSLYNLQILRLQYYGID